eukprot:6199373-Pleurochrysis_carterae.AAC.3
MTASGDQVLLLYAPRTSLGPAAPPYDIQNYRNSRSKAALGQSRSLRPTFTDHARLSWRVLPF